ncbi:MAG TPA: protein-glutamate O-methyltransferase CheR [Opitutus sp.]|nr:protein-glutamate O-methyltransferase CheR [Opitutus sp.]
MRDNEFEFIRTLVYDRSRIHLGPEKRELVSARLGKRLRAARLATVGEYCELLRSPGADEEISHLIDAISTNHTFFFRENAHFDFLREVALPELLAKRQARRWARLNVWSAACSSGEEPYSIAMILDENLGATGWPWRVEATDISHRVLARATAGIYRDDVVQKLPAGYAQRYFQRGFGPQEGNQRVKPALRNAVAFGQLNLLEGQPASPEPFQVIFCRNVMIYFDRPTQQQLVNKLARHLVPGGYLLVGHSESLTGIKHSLQTIRPAVYRLPEHTP